MDRIDFKKKRCWQKVDNCIFGKLIDTEDENGNFVGWICPVGVATKDSEMVGRLVGFTIDSQSPTAEAYHVLTPEQVRSEFGIDTNPDIVDEFADATPASKSKAYLELFKEWRKAYEKTSASPQYMIYRTSDVVD